MDAAISGVSRRQSPPSPSSRRLCNCPGASAPDLFRPEKCGIIGRMPDASWKFLHESSPPLRGQRPPRPKRQLLWSFGVTAVTAALLLIAAAIAWKLVHVEQKASLEILPIPDMEVGSRQTLERTIAARASAAPRSQWRFSLEHAPPGADIDAQTGRFVWRPAEHRAATKYHLAVRVAAGELSAQRSFRITVLPRPEDSGRPAGEKPTPSDTQVTQFTQDVPPHLAEEARGEENRTMQAAPSPAIVQTPSQTNEPLAPKSKPDVGDQVLIDLYRRHGLLSKSDYPAIRHVFASRFETDHEDAIRSAFGEKSSAFRKWLDKRAERQRRVLSRLDPEHDDVPTGARVVSGDLRPVS